MTTIKRRSFIDDGELDLVLDALTEHSCQPHPQGRGWSSLCPAHDDKRPSLSIASGQARPVVLHCHAGCAFDDVLDAIGLKPADVKADRLPPGCVAAYDYRDEHGNVMFQKRRHEPKDFTIWHPDRAGAWCSGMGGAEKVPYLLPELIEGVRARETIYIVEGEKDAEAMAAAGYVATCNPGGAAEKWDNRFNYYLGGAQAVVVVADADDPGRKHALEVAGAIRASGVVRDAIVVVEPPGEGKDAADHLAAGLWPDDFVPLDEQRALEALPPYFLDLAQIRELPPPTWLVDGILAQGSVAVLWGKWNVGKSFLALAWALCLATGRSWLGRAVERCDVYYVLAEGQHGIRQRIDAWIHTEGVEPDAGFKLKPSYLDLRREAVVEEFVAEARSGRTGDGRPVMVIIDTLAKCIPGADENSAQDMGVVLSNLELIRGGLGATVLLLHHPGRDEKNPRGSSALDGGVDTILRLKGNDGQLLLSADKQKDAAAFAPVDLTLTAAHDSCVITDAVERAAEALPARPAQLLAVITDLTGSGQTPVPFSEVRSALSHTTSSDDRHLATLEKMRLVTVTKRSNRKIVNLISTNS